MDALDKAESLPRLHKANGSQCTPLRNFGSGRPSTRYILRGIVRCERCDGRMHGKTIGRKGEARYSCSTRAKRHDCGQPLAGARAALKDFGRSWQGETDPQVRRELLAQLFERVWIDAKKIVAVRPTPAFAALFSPPETTKPPSKGRRCAKDGSDGTRTRDLRRDRPAL
jgi:hypothetical protein